METYQLPKSTLECTEDFSKYNAEGTLLRKVQKRSLEIMVEIDRVCRKNNIEYWINYGTLLGAVRHGGFIPWDDDIDISVRWSDVKKLRKAFKRDLDPKFVYQDWTTDKKYFLDSVIKIRDTRSYFPIGVYKGFKEQGLLVDIIPMEKMPSLILRKILFKLNKWPYLMKKEYSLGVRIQKPVLGVLLWPFAEALKSILHFYSKVSSSRRWGVNYTFYDKGCESWLYDESLLFPLKEAKFEEYSFYVPNDAISILKGRYGDSCLEIPSDELRITHAQNVIFYD